MTLWFLSHPGHLNVEVLELRSLDLLLDHRSHKTHFNSIHSVCYLGAGMDWKAPSWQESWGRYSCWPATEGTASWERWGMRCRRLLLRLAHRRLAHPRHRCAAAGRSPERWRWAACAAHCGWGCGIAPASCAAGWTRCAAEPGQEEALESKESTEGES